MNSPGQVERLEELFQFIGRWCKLPDGSDARIVAVAITGAWHRIEYQLVWWYHGERHEAWMEPMELSFPDL